MNLCREKFYMFILQHRINLNITAQEVRLVGEGVEPGVFPLSKAQSIASQMGLDLVEISPKASPPVCKIIDYKKIVNFLKIYVSFCCLDPKLEL